MKLVIAAALLLEASVVLAAEWNCRNYDAEISCTEEKCEISAPDGFTPLDAYFDSTGKMSVGMYTGVWEGKGKVVQEQDFFVVIGDDLASSTSPDTKSDILIALDTRDNVAVFKDDGYAMPMRCKQTNANQ